MIEHGADITGVDKYGETALHHAARNYRHLDVLQFVLDQGLFDIERRNRSLDETALHVAAKYGNSKGCELLISRGADVNSKSIYLGGCTILFILFTATAYHHSESSIEIARILLDYGADTTIGAHGMSLLERAARLRSKPCSNIQRILVRHMAKLEHLNLGINEEDRRTIDNDAVYKEHYQVCLREFGTMKRDKFYGNVSIFSILMDSERVISGFARNEELVRALEENDYRKQYPIYFACLVKRFYAQVKKQRFRRAAAIILQEIFMLSDLSHPVIGNVLLYLKDHDLDGLCSESAPDSV